MTQQPVYSQQQHYPPSQGGQSQFTPQFTPTGPPQPGVIQSVPVVAVISPQSLYRRHPEQYRTCGIVTSLVFTMIVFFGNILGLGSDMLYFESDTSPDFSGGISHYDAKFVNGEVEILNLRIDSWSTVEPLGAMAKYYEWSSAMIAISLVLSIPIIIIQICRMCRKLRHRKLWTYLTSTLSIVNVILMLISYGNIYNSTQDHLTDLNAWLLLNGGITQVHAAGSTGFVSVILFSYICSIVLFAFGIRTCVGRKCQDGCCCEWCTCNFAEDNSFKGAARSAANIEANPPGVDNVRTDRADVYEGTL